MPSRPTTSETLPVIPAEEPSSNVVSAPATSTSAPVRSESRSLNEVEAALAAAEAELATYVPARRIRGGEIVRKLMHMLPGALPFLLGLLPHPDPLNTYSIVLVIVVTTILTGIYVLSRKVVKRPTESDFLMTALSYPAIVLLTLVAFPAQLEFVCVVVIVLAFGDGSAYIGGKLFGRKKLPWNPQKSWAGTLSFVLVGGPLAALGYWNAARPEVTLLTAGLCGGTAAVLAAIAESLDVKVTDNLRVGVAALIGVVVSHAVLVGFAG